MKPNRLVPAAFSLLSVLLVGAATGPAFAAATPRPPNIIVILSDDQGYADFSFNPHHPKKSPRPTSMPSRARVCFSRRAISAATSAPPRAPEC